MYATSFCTKAVVLYVQHVRRVDRALPGVQGGNHWWCVYGRQRTAHRDCWPRGTDRPVVIGAKYFCWSVRYQAPAKRTTTATHRYTHRLVDQSACLLYPNNFSDYNSKIVQNLMYFAYVVGVCGEINCTKIVYVMMCPSKIVKISAISAMSHS